MLFIYLKSMAGFLFCFICFIFLCICSKTFNNRFFKGKKNINERNCKTILYAKKAVQFWYYLYTIMVFIRILNQLLYLYLYFSFSNCIMLYVLIDFLLYFYLALIYFLFEFFFQFIVNTTFLFSIYVFHLIFIFHCVLFQFHFN